MAGNSCSPQLSLFSCSSIVYFYFSSHKKNQLKVFVKRCKTYYEYGKKKNAKTPNINDYFFPSFFFVD
jgi:hypothetical protein